MSKQFTKEKTQNIENYITYILTPLDQFYTTHYKDIIYGNHKTKKQLDDTYTVFLEKLEQFTKLVDQTKK